MKKSVCIVGGGASGIMAAIGAAQAGACVTLLEHQDRIGKKILLTGNGKCNLTNLEMDRHAYSISEENALPDQVLKQFGQNELMELFRELGMRLKVCRDSYVYPESEAAATVVNVLRRALDMLEVTCVTDVHIKEIHTEKGITRKDSQFVACTDKGNFEGDCMILACGGKSFPKTGSDGSGFGLAKMLGLKVKQDYPALTAMVCKREGQKILAGLRTDGEVTLYIDGKPAASDRGQVQLTDYGISGIPVFQISAPASKALQEHKDVRIALNLFPEMTTEEVFLEIKNQLHRFQGLPFEEAAAGMLHKKWIDYFKRQSYLKEFARAGSIPDEKIKILAKDLTAMEFPVIQTKGYDFCQVTGGGVDTKQVDCHLQSVKIPGLYIVGEMLDVVGKCGGYNLQWAFSTGYIAGCHSAGRDTISKKDSGLK